MADIKKFLDQGGVSTLWSRIAEEVKKVDDKAVKNAEDIAAQAGDIATMKGQIQALEAGTYDDTAVRALISANTDAIGVNADAIAVLNGDAETAGSVANTASTIAATKVAEIVANADADFDTLKEIADWILNDTTGAADMANDIAALQAQLVGIDETVVKSVAEAIDAALKADGADKYALASDLVDLANRVKALEDAGYMDEVAVNAAIESKITALKLDETYDAKGAAAAAETAAKAYSDANLVTAKAYTDTEFAKIQALSEAEILAAINGTQA